MAGGYWLAVHSVFDAEQDVASAFETRRAGTRDDLSRGEVVAFAQAPPENWYPEDSSHF